MDTTIIIIISVQVVAETIEAVDPITMIIIVPRIEDIVVTIVEVIDIEKNSWEKYKMNTYFY